MFSWRYFFDFESKGKRKSQFQSFKMPLFSLMFLIVPIVLFETIQPLYWLFTLEKTKKNPEFFVHIFGTWKETNTCFLIYDNFIILEKILWKRSSGMKMEKLFKICVNPWFFYFFFLQVQRTFLELLHYYYNFLWREKTGRLLGRIKYRESSFNAAENCTL